MPIERIDLADAGSPDKLVSLILKAEPDLPIPVPIERLCYQLDIQEIAALDIDGFEGGLITDPERSSGIILVKMACVSANASRWATNLAIFSSHGTCPTRRGASCVHAPTCKS